MQRIVVIGSSCSGKSTFAQQLAEKLNVTYVELDALHWLPNWQERCDDEFRLLVKDAANKTDWVIDGNYAVARDLLWPRATTIIWLNHSFTRVLYRAICRSIMRAATKQRLFAGNVETFRQSFCSKDSIIWWVLTTFHAKRRNYQKLLAKAAEQGTTIVELTDQKQVEVFFATLNKR
ncbi:adenylate kinase [Thalassotalea euphylliae]|uniref:Adenylate kinase n=1 Tax=Thalassotalea euphylliae TaxID=1655234 RepID=A0A3E0TTZ2_9GAMM|nr:AAA family ATPase [Thalassotalea euphylliae]REL27827.1 adenylate kinase [Thalassotalea euphylliae]